MSGPSLSQQGPIDFYFLKKKNSRSESKLRHVSALELCALSPLHDTSETISLFYTMDDQDVNCPMHFQNRTLD